jgi:hypothetical protein
MCELSNMFGGYKLCCPADDTCESQTLGEFTIQRCSSQGEFCPSISNSDYETCEPGESCAVLDITSFSIGCCPADNVLCPSLDGSTIPLPTCCPADDECETQTFGDTTIPRCSSQGVICFSESGDDYVTCDLGDTCTHTAINVTNPPDSPLGCCEAGSTLCPPPSGSTVTFDLCCPSGSNCATVSGGVTPYAQCVA